MAKIEKQVWLIQYDDETPYVQGYAPIHGGYKMLAGPVAVTFDIPNACPHCGGALPEAQDKAEPPKELVIEAGGVYRTRGGDEATIVYYSGAAQTYSMIGCIRGKRAKWTATGAWVLGEKSDDDLVERLS